MLVSACSEADGAGAKARGDAVYSKIHLTHQHHEHLLMHVVMSSVRSAARRQLSFVYFKREPMMQVALENRARFVYPTWAAGFHGQLIERIRLRRYGSGLRANAPGGYSRQQQREISSRRFHARQYTTACGRRRRCYNPSNAVRTTGKVGEISRQQRGRGRSHNSSHADVSTHGRHLAGTEG